MKLQDIPHTAKRRLGLRVYDSGEIVLTAPLARKMDVKEGESVKFLYNEEGRHRELFITKCEKGVPTKRRRSGSNSDSLRLYSKEYAKELLNGDKRGIYRVGETVNYDGKDYFTVIYKKNYAEHKV